MIRLLGSTGLICPLVDSLSERSLNARRSVEDAVYEGDFRHLVVTSRHAPPGQQVWDAATRVTTQPLQRNDVDKLVALYAAEFDHSSPEQIRQRLDPFLSVEHTPNPLFLRFAVDQAARGPLDALDSVSLTLAYLESLRSGKVDVSPSDYKRATSLAAIESIQESLTPRGFSEQQLNWALTKEANAAKFYGASGDSELAPPRLVDMLVQSGVIVRGIVNVFFAFDPVAEQLAAWWVNQVPEHEYAVLRQRLIDAADTDVGRAYAAVSAST